ncbi:uncharacterized protein KD926_000711 [Aspergillus affinis]|uniref:uncharacterized protein n=1 Tax=Aspergillus affinis TaxID=1070780 RepID=UPI0022FF1FCA|nr:uncharacterized protein KD926_000711 [Aspergillus affinis]KAI9037206.1 hypothetical protein KD926_000711 [Aspergillus affinis]
MSFSFESAESKPDGSSLLHEENSTGIALPKSGPKEQSGSNKGQSEQLVQHDSFPYCKREWNARKELAARKLELKKLPCPLQNLSMADYYWTYCLGSPCLHGFYPRYIRGRRIICPASFEALMGSDF